MDSLKNALLRHKTIKEPEEFPTIKHFVKERIGIIPKLQTNKKQIYIYVPTAAQAGDLQPQIHQLQKIVPAKLVIRIG